jgi:hypothetical protein
MISSLRQLENDQEISCRCNHTPKDIMDNIKERKDLDRMKAEYFAAKDSK